MNLRIHIENLDRPAAFEPDVAVVNVWGEMILAVVDFVGWSVVPASRGWDVILDGAEVTSFPRNVLTPDSMPEILSQHDAEVALVGTLPPEDDGDFDWDEASEVAAASFEQGGLPLAQCRACRLIMHRSRRYRG